MLLYLDKKILWLGFLLLSSFLAVGQVNSAQFRKDWFSADKTFNKQAYDLALKSYEHLILQDTGNDEIRYKLGVCRFEIRKLRSSSKPYFERVVNEGYREAHYYLGRLAHLEGE